MSKKAKKPQAFAFFCLPPRIIPRHEPVRDTLTPNPPRLALPRSVEGKWRTFAVLSPCISLYFSEEIGTNPKQHLFALWLLSVLVHLPKNQIIWFQKTQRLLLLSDWPTSWLALAQRTRPQKRYDLWRSMLECTYLCITIC